MDFNINAAPHAVNKPSSSDFLDEVAEVFAYEGTLVNDELGKQMAAMQEKDAQQTLNLGVTTAARALLNKMAADSKTTDKPDWYGPEGNALKAALETLPGGHGVWESLQNKGDVQNLAAQYDAKSQEFSTQSQQDQFNLSRAAQKDAADYQNASTFVTKDTSTQLAIIGNVNR